MAEKVEMWKASNGQLYRSEEEADAVIVVEKFKLLLSDTLPRVDSADTEEILDFIYENRIDIAAYCKARAKINIG